MSPKSAQGQYKEFYIYNFNLFENKSQIGQKIDANTSIKKSMAYWFHF